MEQLLQCLQFIYVILNYDASKPHYNLEEQIPIYKTILKEDAGKK